jgi:hypothetical protein
MVLPVRRFLDAVPRSWRNGGGTTSELVDEDLSASLEPGSRWRLSVASLSGPAAFSLFPNRWRTLIPWGGGIVLEVDGERRRLRAGEAFRFSGSAATRLIDLDLPCHAVNLVASGPLPVLLAAAEGARYDREVVALLGDDTADAGCFDAVLLRAGEAMPTAGAVVHPGDDDPLRSSHPGS